MNSGMMSSPGSPLRRPSKSSHWRSEWRIRTALEGSRPCRSANATEPWRLSPEFVDRARRSGNATEPSDLMAEDEDFQVLVGVTPSHTDNQFKESPRAQVEKGEEHDYRSWHPHRNRGQPAVVRTAWLAARSHFWRPTPQVRTTGLHFVSLAQP
jgi:hypothetical protein